MLVSWPKKKLPLHYNARLNDLRREAARLLAESEKTKRTAEALAEKIKHLEKLSTRK